MLNINRLTFQDKDAYIQLKIRVSEQSSFLAFDRGESAALKSRLESTFEDLVSSQHLMGAFWNGELIGFLDLMGTSMKRKSHSLYLIMGVDHSHAGKGIGSALMEEALNLARSLKKSRIELTVIAQNERAISLYQKFGFQKEGVRRNSLLVEGALTDEYAMALVFDSLH